jgi:hypothetical protein
MTFRHLLCAQTTYDKDGLSQKAFEKLASEELLSQIDRKLSSPHETLIVNALYVLSSIANAGGK